MTERHHSAPKGEGKYNVVVIGAGTAGLVTAAGTAALGGRVALVERNRMGGDCLNFGCVPSKALISSARAIHTIRRAADFGLRPQEPQFDFHEVFARMRARRARIEPNDSQERFESLGVDVFRGDAKFLSPHEVEVTGTNGSVRLRAKNFVIAAGSRAGLPPIPGLADVPYFTNETIFDEMHGKPESLLVIGGGPIGCELSQVFQRLGVQVTLLANGPQILVREDPEVAAFVAKRLRAEGVRIVFCSDTLSIAQRDGKIRAVVKVKPPCAPNGDTLEIVADAVLVAAGRIPNVETLNLDAAGVKYTRRGVEVNDYLQTSQPHIYAAGDIAGRHQFTHVADLHARTVIRNILMPLLKTKLDDSIVPWATYLDPEVAHVGMNETEAKRKGVACDVFTQSLEHVDRAIVSDEDAGFAKVLVAKGTDRILGVTLVSAHAGDLLHEFVLAMKHGIGLGKISATVHAYPTFAEVARKLGDSYQRTRLTPLAKKLFAWLYRRARA
jgi:pyruvate/2-oxoglutarate dehydrogenase complex dihydrolipoamide dehydrogenase (E3) component